MAFAEKQFQYYLRIMTKTTFLAMALTMISCNGNTKEENADIKETGTSSIKTTDRSHSVFVKDKTLYDDSFILGLSEYGETLNLIDNYILLGEDTAYFPEELQLNEQKVFHGNSNHRNFQLTITRVKLTSVVYNFLVTTENNKQIINKTGRAVLPSLFFLGSEVDDDEQLGESFLSSEYWDESSGCSLAIRIGEKDEAGNLRAKVKLNCDEESQNIQLKDSPILRAN